ncbi:GMC family oxidoreductase [Ferrimonas pelagia]|uniref:GMC family oxidoreductase n=1 Tax=Ferrimonas pelagia TaxID=1177826 RepID=A0ABP9EQ67_9GAMM
MIPDPIKAGLAQGWQHVDGSQLTESSRIKADVVVIGSGAGGGTAAQILAEAGLAVVIIEAGPLKSSSDFVMQERVAYPDLYQQSAAMKTADQAIGMLQGRNVGGSTTVNWTTSIRTPRQTLAHWAQHFGVEQITPESMAPWFEQAEQALNISPWPVPANANNALMAQGCERLGWDWTVIHRNVRGCADLGYCGMGCPLNAKQSMLVTTIPAALSAGAQLYSRTEAWQLLHDGERVQGVLCHTRDPQHQRRDITVTVEAQQVVLCGGALHSPALLMRSAAPDPHKLLGKRTFLHPTVMALARFAKPVNAHAGAPQSVYSDQFLWPQAPDAMGFKLEAAPLHPMLLSSKAPGFGVAHHRMMQSLNHLQISLALLRDGFADHSPGGRVILDDFGDPVLDYPLHDELWQGIRNAFLQMVRLQFAAGAEAVLVAHDQELWWRDLASAEAGIAQMALAPLQTTVASAHIMGGCGMAGSPEQGVVDSWGRHYQLSNLSVFDGSVLPTSLGANPQLTLYGLARRNAHALLARWPRG